MKSDEHLVIDAYNVMHYFDHYKNLINHDIETARSQFIQEIRIIHDFEAVFLTFVFDGKGSKTEILNPDNSNSLTYIYTASSVSADAVIEKLVSRSKTPEKMTVVSRDNLIAESVRASCGIMMSPEELMSWVDRCNERQGGKIKQQRSKDWKLRDLWD